MSAALLGHSVISTGGEGQALSQARAPMEWMPPEPGQTTALDPAWGHTASQAPRSFPSPPRDTQTPAGKGHTLSQWVSKEAGSVQAQVQAQDRVTLTESRHPSELQFPLQ